MLVTPARSKAWATRRVRKVGPAVAKEPESPRRDRGASNFGTVREVDGGIGNCNRGPAGVMPGLAAVSYGSFMSDR